MLASDRLLALAALVGIAGLAWGVMAWMAVDMGLEDAGAPVAAWTGGYFAAMFVMWAIMMAGMMIPSAAPAILLFGALRRHCGSSGPGPTLLFAAGYLIAWTAFSLLATLAQWRLSEASLLSPGMTSENARLAAALFLVAGVYQFTGLKSACLSHCRSPAQFLARHLRAGSLGPVVTGMHHGAYCVGCCWAVMGLLFAFGVMNLLWVAAIAAFVLAEKVFPAGRRIASLGGVAMVALGVVLFNA